MIDRYAKGRNELRAAEVPEPEVRERDVLVGVHAAAVNVLDSKIRNGEFKLILPYRLPLVLGNDVAGVVTRVGSGVRDFKVGDAVYARPDHDRIGTFAEYIAVDERDLALKPERLTMAEAAAVPLAGLTAWQALVEVADVQAGQKVFIQAGSGGVGTFAIQLAKHLGATVATTTSAANADLVKSIGADIVIDYRKDDFETLLHDYDMVLHSQDSKTLEKSLRVLKPGGQLVSIAGPPDPAFARVLGRPLLVPAMWVLSRRIRKAAASRKVGYKFLFMRANGDQLREIASLIDAGVISPVLDRFFPFEEANEAMAYVDSGRAKGKVVVKVR